MNNRSFLAFVVLLVVLGSLLSMGQSLVTVGSAHGRVLLSDSALDDDLVAYYPFDGDALDYSGNGNHGILHGTSQVPGIVGAAIELNGSGDYIEVPHSQSLNLYGEFTISGWTNDVTPDFTNALWIPILTKGDTSTFDTPYSVIYRETGDEVLPQVRLVDQDYNLIQDFQYDIVPGSALDLNVWSFFTWRFSHGTLAIFLNGVFLGEKDYGISGLGNNTRPLNIGRDVPGIVEYFDGQLDDLRIYNRALSDEEILGLYTRASEVTYSVSGHVIDDTGQPLAGVLITSSSGHSATTDASGTYTLAGLIAGTYTITPSLTGWRFSPVTRTVTLPHEAGAEPPDFVANAVKPWTLMFFSAGDNDAEMESPLKWEYELLPSMATNENVNIVSFWDGLVSEARYDYWFASGDAVSVAKEELNTGDSTTLRDFVDWAQRNYPAEHYALIISDHGHGVGGVALDIHTPELGKDTLTPSELRSALSGLETLDVVYMHACLMGNIESGYQLRGLAEYYVASESMAWLPRHLDWFVLGHESSVPEVPGVTSLTSHTTPEELAEAMSRAYVLETKHAPPYYPGTSSVVQLLQVEDVALSASALAGLLRQLLSESKPILDAARNAMTLQHFNSDMEDWVITDVDEYVDLYEFATLVYAQAVYPDLRNAAYELMQSIDQYVVTAEPGWSGWFRREGELHYWSHEHSHGVSIYMPPKGKRPTFYNADWLDFARGTNWSKPAAVQLASSEEITETIEWMPMWVDYIDLYDPDAVDDPNPPELIPLISIPSVVYLPLVLR